MGKYPKIVPHLVVDGGLKALRFYEDALDAEIETVMMADDGKRVMHAEMDVNDSTIFLCDDFPEFGGGPSAPAKDGRAPVTIHLELKKPKHVDAMMGQAVRHGAEVMMPAMDAFWGARYGKIRDPFGHVWSFGATIRQDHPLADIEASANAKTQSRSKKPRQAGKKVSAKPA